ncbi:MAG: hypothetical protein ABMA64_33290 [Myxococcota bacterium]
MIWATLAFARPCPGPVPFQPGVLSLPDRSEYRVAFSPEGDTVWFHVDTGDGLTVWTASRRGRGWTEPVVAPFSGRWRDADPFVSPDGRSVYFSSYRPVKGDTPRPDADVWVVHRDGDGWGAPIHLGPEVNTERDELYASVTASGTLYWGSDSDEGAGGWDVWRAERAGVDSFAPRENVAAVNTELWEFNPWVSADESRLLFVGLRHPDGLGMGDVYTSVRADGQWQAPRNLGPGLNTAGDDFHPMLGPRHQLVFVRQVWEPLAPSELFVVDARCLGL